MKANFLNVMLGVTSAAGFWPQPPPRQTPRSHPVQQILTAQQKMLTEASALWNEASDYAASMLLGEPQWAEPLAAEQVAEQVAEQQAPDVTKRRRRRHTASAWCASSAVVRGTCKHWNDVKGFGFIQVHESPVAGISSVSHDLFVHYSDIVHDKGARHHRSLEVGEVLTFHIAHHEHTGKLKATRVGRTRGVGAEIADDDSFDDVFDETGLEDAFGHSYRQPGHSATPASPRAGPRRGQGHRSQRPPPRVHNVLMLDAL